MQAYPHVFISDDDVDPVDRAKRGRFHQLCEKRRIIGLTYAEQDELRQLTLDLEQVGLVQRAWT